MSLIKKFNIIFLIIFGFIMTGCSGQSIQKMEEQKGSLYDLNSPDVSNLKLITIDGTTLDLENIEGEFVRKQGSAVVLINEKNGNSSKNVKYEVPIKDLTSFVTYIPEGNSLNGSFGIIGIPESSGDMVEGNYTYLGTSRIFINDGTALYDLTGNSKIQIDFNGLEGLLVGELTSLSGKMSMLNLSCRDCPISNAVDIIFPSGSICNGNRICLNEIELKNGVITNNLTNQYRMESDGTFFGPNSVEIGGVFSIDDTDTGSIEIRGAFLGKNGN